MSLTQPAQNIYNRTIAVAFQDYAALEPSVHELEALIHTAGGTLIDTLLVRLRRIHPAYYLGAGKLDELAQVVCDQKASLVIINRSLSSVQNRNLQLRLNCRVIDRNHLILDIFALHAQSHVGKLQVELAQLSYLSSRLIRAWTHLERQSGGIGLRGGPGETQLETDKRLISTRIKYLKKQLSKVQAQRSLQRKARLSQRNTFNISIVGYTNAGKSTLFNALTHQNVDTANALFVTLDTKTAKMQRSSIGQKSIILSDTVGFIQDLPHALIEAFKSTLEECQYADLLLHVIDHNAPFANQRIAYVNEILSQINADHVPQVLVWSKIDQDNSEPKTRQNEYGRIAEVFVSAKIHSGFDLLKAALIQYSQ